MTDNTPFFIIGSGRSGTTLLRLILAGHSRIHIPPETWFILTLVEELPLETILTLPQVERAVSIMTSDYRWPDMDIAPEVLHRQAVTLKDPRLVDIIDLVYREHLARTGKPRFGDKTPAYFMIVPQLATLYPGARFIHLIRDGRDVAISLIDLDYEHYYQEDFEWTIVMHKRGALLDSHYSSQILEVKYEDLVADPSATVQRICAFLNEQFEPAMLDWTPLLDMVPECERHIHPKLSRPITGDRVGVWRTRLSAFECFAMEACLWRDLVQLDYQLRFSGACWRPLLNMTAWVLHQGAPLIKRAVTGLERRNLLPRRIYL
jgi:hypothetical protein